MFIVCSSPASTEALPEPRAVEVASSGVGKGTDNPRRLELAGFIYIFTYAPCIDATSGSLLWLGVATFRCARAVGPCTRPACSVVRPQRTGATLNMVSLLQVQVAMLAVKAGKTALTVAGAPLMAARSFTWIYPIRGMIYFARNPILWGSLLAMALPQLVLTMVVFTLAYIFLYPPQAAIAFLFNGPVGLLTAWIAMVQQSIAITQVCSAMLLMATPLRLMFDSILTKEGHDRLVLAGKMQREYEVESASRQVTSALKAIPLNVIFPVWAVKMFLRLALSLIPFVGPMILIVLDATDTAARCHSRYFELKGFSEDEAQAYVKDRKAQYFSFGLLAAALESIPFIGITFMFSNTVGGALWAVDVEKRLQAAQSTQGRPRRSRLRFMTG